MLLSSRPSAVHPSPFSHSPIQGRKPGFASSPQWANLSHHVVKLDQYQYFHFLETSSQHFVTIIMVHQQGNLFVLTALHGGGGGGAIRLVLLKNLLFFYATPIYFHFFGLRQTQLNGSISPQHSDVTLDTFTFPAGGRLAARPVFFRPQ